MITWLENPTEEVTKEPEAAEKSWADEDESPVAHLTTDTFKPFLAEHSSVLVSPTLFNVLEDMGCEYYVACFQ